MRGRLSFGLLLVASLALAQPVPATPPVADPFPQAAAAYLVQINQDVRNDNALPASLWAHQATRRLPPASLTKLMTVLLLAESTSAPEHPVVTVTPAATRETGSRLGLRAGERYAHEALLAATLLESANDACHALADHAAGSEARFVERMNQRARSLGLHDTQFTNACGHDADGHYSSAFDLARLAQIVLRQPRLAALVSRHELKISSLDQRRHFSLKNRNALIGRYPGANGVKTGYTPKAGKCLIASVTRNTHQVLLVLLNAPNRWWDAADMLDLAFAHAGD